MHWPRLAHPRCHPCDLTVPRLFSRPLPGRYARQVRLIKIVRLSRIGWIKALRDLQYNGVLHPAAVQLVKLLFLYFFVLHMVACFYWCGAPRGRAACARATLCGNATRARATLCGHATRARAAPLVRRLCARRPACTPPRLGNTPRARGTST